MYETKDSIGLFMRNFGVLIIQNYTNVSGGSKGGPGAPPPPHGLKFSWFHAVFGKFWQNGILALPPPEGRRPLLQGILDPPLNVIYRKIPLLKSAPNKSSNFARSSLTWGSQAEMILETRVQWSVCIDAVATLLHKWRWTSNTTFLMRSLP